MLIRYAEFVGTIKAGKQEEFYDFVESTLTPLWTKFDGAVSVPSAVSSNAMKARPPRLCSLPSPIRITPRLSAPWLATHASSRASRRSIS
jgi:hypothetical protein